MQPCLDRLKGNVHDIRSLFGAESFDVPEVKDHSIFWGKFLHRGRDDLLQFGSQEILGRIVGPVRDLEALFRPVRACQGFKRQFPFGFKFLFAAFTVAGVGGNPEKPVFLILGSYLSPCSRVILSVDVVYSP